MIRSFDALESEMSRRPPLRVVVAGADDDLVLQALETAAARGQIRSATLIGSAAEIRRLLPSALDPFAQIVDAPDPEVCAVKAVAAIRERAGDVLVKGTLNSAAYLRAVVDKSCGLRRAPVLSNLTLAEMPSLDRLIGATDNGIIPAPTLEQKRAILENANGLFAGLGNTCPRVAAIAASEKVSERQPATTDAAQLAAASRRGAFGGMQVDGPFGYDVAVSQAAAQRKGLDGSEVAGKADLILFPNIESGNATVKAWKLHGGARTASIVLGAAAPVLLNSRSDGADQRRLGLVLAQAALAGMEMQS
ncbi:phosphate acyltransferase [Neptunicoccus sediminis]|uniref:phosphate acyltransferase n=1 Tax=Neptunicoccus sediminis TaxID=1892596 RepID=UPI000845EFD7|nr:phosphate acyltransferase [Neptunicoccus sediminis]